jgi:hypothetical protein
MAIRGDCELFEGPFRSAYNRLSPDEAVVFRQASVLPGTKISVAAIAIALGLPEHVIRARLGALADIHHLVEPDPISREFRYDPLIKIYARRKAAELGDSRAATMERERATSVG